MEKRTWVKLIVTMLVIAGIGGGIYLQWYWGVEAAGPGVVWGTGRPSEAEKSYYKNRIGKIIENWQNTRRGAERGENGRFKDSYNTLLVIDIAGNAFWIERAGRIQPENRLEFPSNMKWTFHRTTPQGRSELPGQTRLKLRGYNSDQRFGEQFHLVGTRRGSGYIKYDFGSRGSGSGSGYGSYTMPAYSSWKKNAKDPYPSLVVTEAEYEEYLKKAASADPNDLDNQDAGDESLSAKNRASWAKVEKLLYQQIEREMLKAGYSLRSVKVEAGPDYSAGHARFGVRPEGVFREMFGGSYWGDIYLKIDLLGDDIWYASNAAGPQQGGMPLQRGGVDVEFLICSSGDIPDSKRGELLEKGRKMQKSLAVAPPSKWKVKLANGAVVQFIGICENPSAGKKWWGPDGGPIDYFPYVNAEAYNRRHEDSNRYELIWKVEYPKMPNGSRGGGTSPKLEGSMGGSIGGSVRDRYGSRSSGGFSSGTYSFKTSRKKTTLKLDVRVGSGEYERVEFRNISLVRGEDQGFEVKIIPRNPPSIWKTTLSNGTKVELTGICESPTSGKKWWGGDGTILDYPPFYTTESSSRLEKGKKLYEMTWNVHYPSQADFSKSKDTKFHIEDSSAEHSRSRGRRYGDRMRRSYANIYTFDKSRREVTVKIEVKIGEDEYERIEFRNMSLVPGEDRGFKIEAEKKK